MKSIKTGLTDEQKRAKLMEKWNRGILCQTPSKKRIRAYKRGIQKMRRDRRNIVAQSDEYITAAMEQERLVQEMRGGEQDGLGKTSVE